MTPARRIARIRRWLGKTPRHHGFMVDVLFVHDTEDWDRMGYANTLMCDELEWLADYAEGKR
mgnify:CR=1 FL=1